MSTSESATVPLTGAPAAGAPAASTPAPATSAAIPATGSTPPAAPSGFSIPDEFKEKPYLKGVDSQEKLFKMLDGAQELIGKRPSGIPGPEATPEEKAKFWESVGKPKTADEYKFETDPSIKINDKYVGEVKALMHKYNLTAEQATGLQKDVDALNMKYAKESGELDKITNTNFDKLASTLFGADREKVMATAKGLLDQFTPPSLRGELAKLSNENLVVLAGVLRGINDKYIKADSAPNMGGIVGGSTPESMREEARKLMQSPAYSNPMDPNHDSTLKKINELYRQATGGK